MEKKYNFERTFSIRTVICFFLMMFSFLSCILRVAVVASGNYSQVQQVQSSYRIEIGSLRGTIYDCNRIPITNSVTKEIAAVIPSNISLTAVSKAVTEEKRAEIVKLIADGAPFLTETQEKINCDTACSTTYYIHNYSGLPAAHLIGYTDSSGHGVSGLEKAFDNLLYSDKKVSAVFYTDGRGNVLPGDGIKIENDKGVIANGVVSTIDINIQLIAEAESKSIKKGAVVIADAKSGKIRAMVSRPDYDPTQVSEYLKNEDSPLYNRCISAYNVGSAFKPCVAAAALENNKAGYTFTCNGYETIADRRFNCHKKDGHGTVNLKKAISFSCNVFFYNMAFKMGGDSVYGMAASLGFGQRIKLADNYYSSAGNLTSKAALTNEAELANLSIGQGKLLLSPVAMLNLYCAIASDGSYYVPTVVEGILSDGEYTASKTNAPTRVMSEKTASILRNYLAEVVLEGTGIAAKLKNGTAAGKTATAQTGKYENGVEITHSWFCGFFPVENPRYVVVVMAEGGTGTAEVFARIADRILEMQL